ncbi:uncharacterized protein LOC141851343 [Brevipalpus obovatus]|uniref:uncharacterized protein LOC141851343 n=1 Tax=Brevipalpus obovatus TaxID=246614 RepID=UPI003D9FA2E8
MVSTPETSHLKLISTENSRNDWSSLPYRKFVGALMFLTSVLRPEIAFEVSRDAQFMSSYGKNHLIAVKRVIRYLKGRSSHGIKYTHGKSKLKAFADADYAANLDSRKSVSGFVLTLAGGPITWASREQ